MCPFGFPEKAFQVMILSSSITTFAPIGAIAYAPLSPSGPSTSIASVFPSAGKLWQFAQVGMSCIRMRLSSRETSFSLHWMSGCAD